MEEKDLEKLTATKLREIAKQYEGITGVHAMKKEDLIRAIREARGKPKKLVKKDKTQSISKTKKEIKTLKEHKKAAQEKKDKKEVSLLRKKIKKYRRLTRKIARARA
ncbi:MAG: Rho termination factor N-terminal domain-containing protein [Deltaproteobacteria bacterium]|nr:Rho termination factor N-terminal domain-containing protein [Deltaproteobacteria bacterium]